MDERIAEKKRRLLDCLDKGLSMIHLDARRPGVLVPVPLRSEAHLMLNLSYRFDPPDLTVSDWGVRETLSFSGTRFTVAVPWSSLYGVSSHVTREFWLFPEDMPEELVGQLQITSKVPLEALRARPTLRAVDGEAQPSAGEPPAQAQNEPAPPPAELASAPVETARPPKPPAGRSHLRLVK